jgi:hypothetical protein
MCYDFEADFKIKKTDTIWIISQGPSLDLFDYGEIDRKKHITITINGAISAFQGADYHLGSDTCAVNGYVNEWKPPTLWITKPDNEKILIEKGISFLPRRNLYANEHLLGFKGSGSDSILLAYYLCHYQKSIKYVKYIGLDMCDVKYKGKHFQYPHGVRVLDWQERLQLPEGWIDDPEYRLTSTECNSYFAQKNRLRDVLNHIPDLREKLVSYSFYDLKTQRYDVSRFPVLQKRVNITQ